MNTLRKNLLFIVMLAGMLVLAGCHAEQTSAPGPDYGVSTPIDGLPDYLSDLVFAQIETVSIQKCPQAG